MKSISLRMIWLLLLAMLLGVSNSALAATAQTITFNATANQTYGVAPITVSATGGASGNAVIFSSTTTTICTSGGTNGATITIIAVGTCIVAANQAGGTKGGVTYSAATQKTQSFTVAEANQTITFGSQPNRTDAARPFAVAATASSGLTVTLTSTTTSICTVSGLTVSVVADGTCTLIASQAGNGNYFAASSVTQAFSITPFCVPPTNIPSGVSVTCNCDTFNRSTLNPSTMFGGTNWAVSNSDNLGNPYINSTTGLLRLTENTGDNAKAATAPGIYPAAGNYISVEFNHFAYNGSGADGLAVTLSDSSIPAVPGGYGGSQGYAPEGTPGFAGGWLGVALDEYGNYSNPTEGRTGGPGVTAEEVGMRGPGKGTAGYNWIGGTASNAGGLSIDNHTATSPAPGYMYQVVVDSRNEASGTVSVGVNRDSTTFDGQNYSTLISSTNVYSAAAAAQSAGWITQVVPNYWQISFTSSTGGSTNIHEIGDMRICAQTVYPPSGGQASGFSAIDSAYPIASGTTAPAVQNFQTGDIYMKVVGKPFQLWVAALTSSGISKAYSATTTKYVQLNLVQNTGTAACGPDSARTCTSTCTGQSPVPGGNQILTYTAATQGALLSSSITLNTAYPDLVAVMKECATSACTTFTSTAPACSVDSFSVRPTGVTTVTSTNATNTGTNGTPSFTAANTSVSGNFNITATVIGVSGQPSGYTGNLKINNGAVSGTTAAPNLGMVASVSAPPLSFSPAVPGTGTALGTSIASGNFTYSEVGQFFLTGFADTDTNPAHVRGVYDGVEQSECTTTNACDALRAQTWTGVDSLSEKNDCNNQSNDGSSTVDPSFSNTIDASGKYGCNFGNIAVSSTMGRFTPDHYTVTALATIQNRSDIAACSSPPSPSILPSSFSYMGEPFSVGFTLQAMNANNTVTKNYNGAYVSFTDGANSWAATGNNTIGLAMSATNYPNGIFTCSAFFSATGVTSYSCTGGTAPATVANGGVPRVAISPATSLQPTMAWSNGVGTFTANAILQRLTAGPDGPFETLNVGVLPTDADGVTTTGFSNGSAPSTGLNLITNNGPASPNPDRVAIGTTSELFGRMKLASVVGSSQYSLSVPVTVQYWNGSGFVTNAASTAYPNQYDSCTVIPGSQIAMAFQGTIAACNTSVPTSVTISQGQSSLLLPAPGSTRTGAVTLTPLLTAASGTPTTCVGTAAKSSAVVGTDSYLLGKWGTATGYTANPFGTATFGSYNGNPAVIYLRELY